MTLRPDLALIADWVAPGARVLDLGCGDGALLAHLR
ncbi:MAG: methionine biosynthesis protein MetW, partial [Betaproteobacteria bacterium]